MDAPVGHERNAEQIAFWNGPGGEHWVAKQAMQETVLAPFCDFLIDRAKPVAGERVVDVGCGCGGTTFAFADRVGPAGHALGVDISAPMLARARELSQGKANVEFVLVDATIHAFAPASFDILASRFGVMFFAQPALSFANMRKALRPGGRLTFVCWRTPRDNPWLMLPLTAVYEHVPKLPQLGPEDPGPFSFASEERVHRVLGEAGFSSIAMERQDVSLDVAAGKGLEVAVKTALESGPANRALEGQPEEKVKASIESIRKALTPLQKGNSVPLGASVWLVTAVSP
jgi:SAM-dependent methyltransferase